MEKFNFALFSLLVMTVILITNLQEGVEAGRRGAGRQGRLFSLFNVVTFRNDECNTTLAGSLSRLGTCFSAGDCALAGGSGRGSCAAGFGVCCVLVETDGRDQVSRNRTYVQNAGFPSATGGSNSQSFTINKESPDICMLRLDLVTFALAPPTEITPAAPPNAPNDGFCQDLLAINLASTNQMIPQLCGTNDGQHLYVEFGPASTDSVTLSFSLGNVASATSTWDILTSQIECGSISAPPPGCLQYHFGNQNGRITTFNFFSPTVSSHLNDHDYAICIRREKGFCCTQYQVCQDQMDAFSLSRMANSMVDTMCTRDFIALEGSAECRVDSSPPLSTRFCGLALNVAMQPVSIPICDCAAPFELQVITDKVVDDTAALTPSRGACLDFNLLPC